MAFSGVSALKLLTFLVIIAVTFSLILAEAHSYEMAGKCGKQLLKFKLRKFKLMKQAAAVGLSFKSAKFALKGPFEGLVRLKRSATPLRAYTFSGFNPTNGFAAFATSSNHLPYYQIPSGLPQPPSMQSRGDTVSPDSPPTVEIQPPSSDSQLPSAEYAPPSSGESQQTLIPSNEVAPIGSSAASASVTKQSENKLSPAAQVAGDDDDDEKEGANSKTKGNSNSSFNAWFPIVLGTFPSAGQRGQNYAGSESSRDSVSAPLNEPQGPAGGLGTTVIANSVSHGKGSVASSHAIAYGGEAPSLQLYRKV